MGVGGLVFSGAVRRAAALALAAGVVGCSTVDTLFDPAPRGITAADCRAANWREVGEIDAIRGHPDSRFLAYQEGCASFGVIPDPAAYAEGRADGARIYCSDAQAYREGRAGRALRPEACPVPGPRRAEAYAHGQQFRKLRLELKRLDDRSAGLPTATASGVTPSGGGRTPLYATPEFNPISPRRRAALQSEMRLYSTWPPEAATGG